MGRSGFVAAGWRIVEAGCSAPFILIPHEVGECHRLCPVSFGDFVCFFWGGRGGGRHGCRVLFRDFVCQFGVKMFVKMFVQTLIPVLEALLASARGVA